MCVFHWSSYVNIWVIVCVCVFVCVGVISVCGERVGLGWE